ncbi:hypothetical protein [Enterococcus sp. LJL128]
MTLGKIYLHPLYDYRSSSHETVYNYVGFAREFMGKEEPKLSIVGSIYNEVDSAGLSIAEYLLSETNKQSDTMNLLQEFFTKIGYEGANWEKEKTLADIKSLAITDFTKYITDWEIENSILSKNDSYELDLDFIQNSESFQAYSELAKGCYESLEIYPNSFKKKSKDYLWSDYVKELTKHLNALNLFSEQLEDLEEKDTGVWLKLLGSEYNIYCSGKGNKESLKIFKTAHPDPEKDEIITCIPHTKLFTNYSDERIYFKWPEKAKEKIIIAHIGRHIKAK